MNLFYVFWIQIPLALKYNVENSSKYLWWPIGILIRVFATSTGNLGLIPDRVIPKTQKIVIDASLQNTQYYHIYQPLRSGRIWHKVNF